jgi:tetratricopeptide (TPR) repeat protein
MKKVLMIVLITLLVLSVFAKQRQKLSPQNNLNLKSANVYYTQKDNDSSLLKALKLYNAILHDSPDNAIALKRSADLNYFFGVKNEPRIDVKGDDTTYVNFDKAAVSIDFYKAAYAKFDSVLVVMKDFTNLTKDEGVMKRDSIKKKESCWVRIFKIGQLLVEKKEYALAISTFETLYQYNPTKDDPLRMLVSIYQKQGNDTQIETYLEKIIAAKPNDMDMIKLLAAHYYNKDNYKKAAPYFKQIQANDPYDTNNLLLLANSYLKMDNNQEALNTLNLVLKLEPENLDALLSAKDLAMTLNNTDAEIGYWKQILALDSSMEDKTEYKANLEKYCYRMYTLQKFDGLMEYAEKWFNLDTTNKSAADMCTLVANKIGRKDLEKKYSDISKKLQ